MKTTSMKTTSLMTSSHPESRILKALMSLGHEVYLGMVRSRVYRRGEVLFSEGDEARSIHVVKKGSVRLVKQDPSGRDRVIGIFGEGDVIGAAEVLTGTPYLVTAVARGKVVTAKIPFRALRELAMRHPALAFAVGEDLGLTFAGVLGSVEHLSVGRAQERIASLLVSLAGRWPGETPGQIPIGLTRQEIADMAGVTVETCIRTISKFRKDGLIRQFPRKSMVIDVAALQSLAGAA